MATKKKQQVLEPQTPAPLRDERGRFPAGVSGNPNGRPKGKRNEITDVVQTLELAVRKGISPDRIAKIVDRLINAAENGSIQASRIILDKVLPNARADADEESSTPSVHIVIQNATQKPTERLVGDSDALPKIRVTNVLTQDKSNGENGNE